MQRHLFLGVCSLSIRGLGLSAAWVLESVYMVWGCDLSGCSMVQIWMISAGGTLDRNTVSSPRPYHRLEDRHH